MNIEDYCHKYMLLLITLNWVGADVSPLVLNIATLGSPSAMLKGYTKGCGEEQ